MFLAVELQSSKVYVSPRSQGLVVTPNHLIRRLATSSRCLIRAGIRDISLTDTFVGEYRLVKVVGGGGRGEPAEYVLPGLVDANRITVDFSVPPKGGPPNLTGVLTLPTPGRPGATAIVWPDGNKWPQERK